MGGYRQLPITPYNPPDPLEQQGKVEHLKSLKQAQQMQQGQMQLQQGAIQQQQMDLASQKALMRAYQEAGGDLDKTATLAGKYGAKPADLMKLREASIKAQEQNLALLNAKGARALQEADLMQGAHDAVMGVPAAQRPIIYQQQLQSLAKAGVDISQVPQQYPGDQAFAVIGIGLKGHKQQLEELAKEAGIINKQADTQIKQKEAENLQQFGSKEQRKPVPGVDVPLSPEVEAQKKRMAAAGRANVNIFNKDDAKAVADAIESGDQPPTIQGLYRNAGPVRAELAKRGVPLAKMEMDWKATQKFLSTLNGPQQLRMQQSINSAEGMLDKIEALYGEWKQIAPTSGYKILNKASLAAMKNIPGRPGAVAQALDTQIADLTADLGNVYMGGNTPTDQALKLASKNLSADWNQSQFEEGLKQARMNVRIRANSMRHSVPSGVSADSLYQVPGQQKEQPKADPLGIR